MPTKEFKLEEAIVKMCRAVGLRLSFQEVLEWSKRDDKWYTRMTWTTKERDNFKSWFIKRAGKKWGKQAAEREWSWFNLMYGWKELD